MKGISSPCNQHILVAITIHIRKGDGTDIYTIKWSARHLCVASVSVVGVQFGYSLKGISSPCNQHIGVVIAIHIRKDDGTKTYSIKWSVRHLCVASVSVVGVQFGYWLIGISLPCNQHILVVIAIHIRKGDGSMHYSIKWRPRHLCVASVSVVGVQFGYSLIGVVVPCNQRILIVIAIHIRKGDGT